MLLSVKKAPHQFAYPYWDMGTFRLDVRCYNQADVRNKHIMAHFVCVCIYE